MTRYKCVITWTCLDFKDVRSLSDSCINICAAIIITKFGLSYKNIAFIEITELTRGKKKSSSWSVVKKVEKMATVDSVFGVADGVNAMTEIAQTSGVDLLKKFGSAVSVAGDAVKP